MHLAWYLETDGAGAYGKTGFRQAVLHTFKQEPLNKVFCETVFFSMLLDA